MKEIILTGIKPTGTPHLGNYLAVIRPAIEMSKQNNEDMQFYFIADYHALTTLKNAEDMKKYTYEIACTWLACGLDPKRTIFYKQSDIPETFELSCILGNVTPKGLMNRSHAYKALVQQNLENNIDADVNINMGLYNYPILMAADILLFNTKKVPVGQDQKQHVEIARDIARAFNKKYGKSLVLPTEVIKEDVKIIEGLDGRKMSKSYGNVISLFCSEQELKKLINKIKTDSSLPEEPKNTDCIIFSLYKQFASKEKINELKARFEKGISWGEAKSELFEVVNEYLSPMREKYNYYMDNKNLVDEILDKGAKQTKQIAKETIERVRKAIGVRK